MEISTVDADIKFWADYRPITEKFNDTGYYDFIAAWPLRYYVSRIRSMGLVDFENVLDVGCGYGHWTMALSKTNKHVEGFDLHQGRVEIANAIITDTQAPNVKVTVGNGNQLEYSDSSFDLIFCYGVLMFLDQKSAISEFNRVLKPGGRIYICQNGPGWWLQLFLKNLFKNHLLTKSAFKSFFWGRKGVLPSSLSIKKIPELFAPEYWSLVASGAEGDLASEDCLPIYRPAKFMGMDYVIEYIVEKR